MYLTSWLLCGQKPDEGVATTNEAAVDAGEPASSESKGARTSFKSQQTAHNRNLQSEEPNYQWRGSVFCHLPIKQIRGERFDRPATVPSPVPPAWPPGCQGVKAPGPETPHPLPSLRPSAASHIFASPSGHSTPSFPLLMLLILLILPRSLVDLISPLLSLFLLPANIETFAINSSPLHSPRAATLSQAFSQSPRSFTPFPVPFSPFLLPVPLAF
ncbi:unnamed protein product [Cutaneotrichosporon oleaginosum]